MSDPIRCPYYILGDNVRRMIPQHQGQWYICEICGHVVMSDNRGPVFLPSPWVERTQNALSQPFLGGTLKSKKAKNAILKSLSHVWRIVHAGLSRSNFCLTYKKYKTAIWSRRDYLTAGGKVHRLVARLNPFWSVESV